MADLLLKLAINTINPNPKSKRKIIVTEVKLRFLIHIYMNHPCPNTGTSIKSGGVKLVRYVSPPFNEMMPSCNFFLL
jgi:hypothetical protein